MAPSVSAGKPASIWNNSPEGMPLHAPRAGKNTRRRMRVPYTADNLPPEDGAPLLAQGLSPEASELREYEQRMRQEEDKALAREAYAQLRAEASAFLYGEKGLYSSKGKDTREAVARMRDWFVQSTERLGRDLSSGAADLFERMAFSLRVPLVEGVARHQVREKFAWEVDSLNKQIEAEQAIAADCFGDPRSFEAALERQARAIHELGEKILLTPEAQLERIALAASLACTMRVDRFVQAGLLDEADQALLDSRIRMQDFRPAEARLEKAWGDRQMEEGYRLMREDPDELIRLVENHFAASAPSDAQVRQGPESPGTARDTPRRLRGLDDARAQDLLDAALRYALLAHANAALDMVRDLPFAEAQAILHSPAARAALELKQGLTDEEAQTALRMLMAEARQAEMLRERQRLHVEKAGLEALVQKGMDLAASPETIRQLYATLLTIPDDFAWKTAARTTLENGTMGKDDDPVFLAEIALWLCHSLKPEADAVQARLLRGMAGGRLSPEGKTLIESLHQSLGQAEGYYYRKAIIDLYRLLDGTNSADGLRLLLPLLDKAKADGKLADALDPANPDTLVHKVLRIVTDGPAQDAQATAMRLETEGDDLPVPHDAGNPI